MREPNRKTGLLLCLVHFLVLLRFTVALEVHLWPQPQLVEWGTGPPIPLSSSFYINPGSGASAVLQLAARRYSNLLHRERWLPIQTTTSEQGWSQCSSELRSLEIAVADAGAELQHGVDESYSIQVKGCDSTTTSSATPVAVLSAKTVWGALHGLETFSQLVRRGNAAHPKLFIPHSVLVNDAPNFPHRGISLDTSRNFYPVDAILRTLQAMAYNKLNVFHWHITDSHSFPLELSKEPELASLGAYGEKERYSRSEVRKIIEFARLRGVRVIPEIDMPGKMTDSPFTFFSFSVMHSSKTFATSSFGTTFSTSFGLVCAGHTGSWALAYPDIVACHDQFWLAPSGLWSERFAAEPGGVGQLNPLRPQTYTVVKNVVDEVADLFPDDFYHGGGDEVAPGCWNNSTDIQVLGVLDQGRFSTTSPSTSYLKFSASCAACPLL